MILTIVNLKMLANSMVEVCNFLYNVDLKMLANLMVEICNFLDDRRPQDAVLFDGGTMQLFRQSATSRC